MEDYFHVIARIKAYQARGGSYMQFILNFGIITANIALFSSWFDSHHIPLQMAIIGGAIAYLFITTLFGYFDKKYGLWSHEMEFNSNINPFMLNLDKKVSKILKKMEV